MLAFAGLESACESFTDHINARPHRATRRAPAEMLAEERASAAPIARPHPYTAPRLRPHRLSMHADGGALDGGEYSVPSRLAR